MMYIFKRGKHQPTNVSPLSHRLHIEFRKDGTTRGSKVHSQIITTNDVRKQYQITLHCTAHPVNSCHGCM